MTLSYEYCGKQQVDILRSTGGCERVGEVLPSRAAEFERARTVKRIDEFWIFKIPVL